MKAILVLHLIAMLLCLPFVTLSLAASAENTIGKIRIVGNNTLTSEAIVKMSGHKVGDLCTDQTLREMREQLIHTGNFGMHHPDKTDNWVTLKAQDTGGGKCLVTITVDENDKVKSIAVTGTNPIKPEEVMWLIHPGAVFNPEQLSKDVLAIMNRYLREGYNMAVGDALGMDPQNPGTLLIPIVVTKVDRIVIEGADARLKARIQKKLKTQPGDYFNLAIYETDRKAIENMKPGSKVFASETQVGKGLVRLTLSIQPKEKTRPTKP